VADSSDCRVGGTARPVGFGCRRHSIQLAIISGKIAHLYLTRRESLIKLANSYLLPIHVARGRAHAKLYRHGVEITLNTTRHESCLTASQCGTAADTKHEAQVSCLRLSRHNTVRAQDFSARHAKHGTITTTLCQRQSNCARIPEGFLTRGIMCPMYNFVTYNWRNLSTKCMLLASLASEPRASRAERRGPLARGLARTLARWLASRANTLARSARWSGILGSLGSARPAR
jgi:hypothetical protein